ncbi:MAG TPA: TetR/AcrR family transcriptional regulator [Burkholderiaceae bacterium]
MTRPSTPGKRPSKPAGKAPRVTDPASRVSARDKTLSAALTLFNDQGMHAVSTRHMAEHVGISPGNLYYHFRNKEDVVLALYESMEADLLRILQLPAERSVKLAHVLSYVVHLFTHLWTYRFFYRDVVSHLEAMPHVAARYRELSAQVLASGRAIYAEMVRSGVMSATDEQIPVITTNSWIVLSHWFSYQQSLGHPQAIGRDDVREGVRHFVAQFYPYLKPAARKQLDVLLTDSMFDGLFGATSPAGAA